MLDLDWRMLGTAHAAFLSLMDALFSAPLLLLLGAGMACCFLLSLAVCLMLQPLGLYLGMAILESEPSCAGVVEIQETEAEPVAELEMGGLGQQSFKSPEVEVLCAGEKQDPVCPQASD